MKRILSLMLILIVGAFLFASDNNDDTNFSEKLFAQLEQDTLTVTGEDVEPEITKEQDQDTLVTDEKEEELPLNAGIFLLASGRAKLVGNK